MTFANCERVNDPNVIAAWIGVLAAFASGAVLGLFFHRADWLGGYGSWRRRLLRLGHIALVALGGVNSDDIENMSGGWGKSAI